MPKVSIIVPVYNVEQYLPKCIESLVSQTLQEIEIILVDDGSTDKSVEICDIYALQDSRIKVIHKQNGGLSDARNIGIEVAKGDYIAFLDSDDWVETSMYEYLYELAEKENAYIVQCDYIKTYDETEEIDFKECIQETIHTNIDALNLLFGKEHVKTIVVWNKLYHNSLFKDNKFPKGKVHEDEFLTYKLIYKTNKLINSNRPLLYYRQRNGSIMMQGFNEKRLHIVEALEERKAYFKMKGLKEASLKTESNLCGILKLLYVQASESKLDNKRFILKKLKQYIARNYIKFLMNPYITYRGKISLSICMLNNKRFCKMYKSYSKNI